MKFLPSVNPAIYGTVSIDSEVEIFTLANSFVFKATRHLPVLPED